MLHSFLTPGVLEGLLCAMGKYSKSSITSAVFPVSCGEVVCLLLGGIAD